MWFFLDLSAWKLKAQFVKSVLSSLKEFHSSKKKIGKKGIDRFELVIIQWVSSKRPFPYWYLYPYREKLDFFSEMSFSLQNDKIELFIFLYEELVQGRHEGGSFSFNLVWIVSYL